ncbi:MAG: hypothetical protein LBD41_01920 [Clostridiales Family XIII bacterium]|nr:hypothetical protein [Clostridiales Family XIII bacterium]
MKKEEKVLSNKADVNLEKTKASIFGDSELEEKVFFLLKDNYHEFSIDIITILKCLRFAEEKLLIPELSIDFWIDVKNRYCFSEDGFTYKNINV